MTGIYFSGSALLVILLLFARNKALIWGISLLFLAIQTCFSVYGYLEQGSTEWLFFSFDRAGVLLLWIATLVGWASFLFGMIWFKDESLARLKYYHAAFVGLMVSMTGAYLSNDFTVMWVFVEATTLTVAALIYHDRTASSLEATWKYLFVCSIGIAIAYFGILFLSASYSGGKGLDLSFSGMASQVAQTNPLILKIAFLCILVGYSSKMGLFPMHTVAIDAHTVAPPPVSALISTALMNVGFLAIFRTWEVLSVSAIAGWIQSVLLLAGTLSILVSAAYMQKVRHLKRMFAYSSLENMGIVAIGLGLGGWGVYAAFLHILLHSLVKSSLFYQAGFMYRAFGTYDLDKLHSHARLQPLAAGLLLLASVAITAIPPSGLFVSEWIIFRELLARENWWVLVPLALLLVFVLFAFMQRVFVLLSPGEATPGIQPSRAGFFLPSLLFLLLVVYICFHRPPFLEEFIPFSLVSPVP